MSCPRRTGCHQTVQYTYYYDNQQVPMQHHHIMPVVQQQMPAPEQCPAPSGNGYTWVSTNIDDCHELKSRGIIGGNESDGTPIYIGKANYNGEILPCKIIPDTNGAYVGYGLAEIPVTEFEMYCKPPELEWVACSDGDVPPNAVPFGKTTANEILYIGRVNHEGSLTPGKIHQLANCCYVPFNGREYSYTEYECLVENK